MSSTPLKGFELTIRLVEVDDFVKKLWDLYKEVRRAGIVQVCNVAIKQSDMCSHGH